MQPLLSPEQLGLDQACATYVSTAVPPEKGQEILRKLQDNIATIRSPSAFVTKLVNEAVSAAAQTAIVPAAQPQVDHRGTASAQHKQLQELSTSMLARLGVDESAVSFLQTLPQQQANLIVERLVNEYDTVRNPSAFVTRLCKECSPEPPGFSRSSMSHGLLQLQNGPLLKPEELGVDEGASDFLKKLPADQMQLILEQIQTEGGNMQNPSAFATYAAKNFLRAASIDVDGPFRPRSIVLRPEQFGLDKRATDFALKLPPPQMQLVLENLQADGAVMRNPSGFVTRMVKNLMRANGDTVADDLVEAQASLQPQRLLAPKPLASAASLRLLTPEEFGLDNAAIEFMYKLAPDDMQRILGQLQQKQREGRNVQNPSGFVTRLAREMIERNGGIPEQRTFGNPSLMDKASLYGAVASFRGLDRSRPY